MKTGLKFLPNLAEFFFANDWSFKFTNYKINISGLKNIFKNDFNRNQFNSAFFIISTLFKLSRFRLKIYTK